MQHGVPGDILRHLKLIKIHISLNFKWILGTRTYYIKDISKSVNHSSQENQLHICGKKKISWLTWNVANTKRTIDVRGLGRRGRSGRQLRAWALSPRSAAHRCPPRPSSRAPRRAPPRWKLHARARSRRPRRQPPRAGDRHSAAPNCRSPPSVREERTAAAKRGDGWGG